MSKKACAVCLMVSALLGGWVPAAEAKHRPKNYCSRSGDVCASAAKVDGERRLRIATAARYFKTYDLCVTGPRGGTVCKQFRMHKKGSVYISSVGWRRRFPHRGKGAYTVRWKAGGSAVTPRLGFHVR